MKLSQADALSKRSPSDNMMSNDSHPGAMPIVPGNETRMMLPQQTRDLAQSLIAQESAAGNSAETMELAAFRVCETLRPPVCAVAGVDGFRALVSRALALARVEAPCLGVLRVAADGSLEGLDEMGRQFDKDQAREGGVILISQFLGLLLTFIGEAMTSRLVTSEVLPPYHSNTKGALPRVLK